MNSECFESSSMLLSDLGLENWLVEQCYSMGISDPTPVQRYCIPKILKGENCIGISQTGSGKTLAFALPILQKLSEDPYGIFALVLTPTRELAIQIAEQFKVIGKPIHLEVSVIIGGMNMVAQGSEINSQPHIMVATPGRLADHLKSSNDFSFKRTRFLVLDEADRLLEGQFTEQLEVIFEALPSQRQTLCFSATMSKNLDELKNISCIKPFVWATESDVSTVEKLEQHYVLVPHMLVKNASLIEVLNNFQGKNPDSSAIIFTKNCKCCQLVSVALHNLGFENVALNSHLKQRERLASISKFKSNKSKLLVATDVASRGLDIPMVDLVINYSVPPVPKNYIHRVGRTARAGKGGLAITFITPREIAPLKRIEDEINTKLTEYKVSDKKVLNILLQVEVAWREAAISVEDEDAEEKKEINKRKEEAMQGTELQENKYKRSKHKQKSNKKIKN
ncbi:LOW QUALITY PROTEIN: probable ATP-dependent RNA helicase DDX49 [Uloborus diversus]|uniref:LOW QUALITY PROTEIN: probable ATP-dependent RNA helicase DDX49 n=1 Tax=Uloborus diversus TaxID=327109 RepID=UPI002409504B|nr:LOW QUALITY PROTEIN: probable ATP-dependent RNA helicase DDX49 [Uloborus diversus]